MKNFLIAIICAITCCTSIIEGACPEWNKTAPCSCIEIKTVTMIRCSGDFGSQRVLAVLSELQPISAWELELESLNATELPSTVASVASLRLKKSNIKQMQKSETITWSKLNEIVIESVHFRNSIWPQLVGAHNLKFVKISDAIIPSIDDEFRENMPSSVEYIELRKTHTSEIDSHSMCHLINLRYIFFTDMPLTRFPRNALPATMNQLHTFVLGNTQIENLEPNFFQGMEKLQVLMLNGNRFSTLEAHLFAPLQSHLNHFLVERNLLQCECNLLWLKTFQEKRSINIFATCFDPGTKQYKEIKDLEEDDYCF